MATIAARAAAGPLGILLFVGSVHVALAQIPDAPLDPATYYMSHNYALGNPIRRGSSEQLGELGPIIANSISDLYNDSQIHGETNIVPTRQPSLSLLGAVTTLAPGASASLAMYAELTYTVRVALLPSAPSLLLSEMVPVNAFAAYYAKTSSSYISSFHQSTVQISIGDWFSDVIFSNCAGIDCNERLVATSAFFVPYDTVSVFLAVSGNASSGEMPAGAARASAEFDVFADPRFEIDQSYAYRDYFSIEYSPNLIESTAAIPEPQTYALLLIGLALLGSQITRPIRRRGRSAVSWRLAKPIRAIA